MGPVGSSLGWTVLAGVTAWAPFASPHALATLPSVRALAGPQ